MGLAETAAKLIAKNGRPVTIRRKVITAGDPTKPWGSAGDTTTITDFPTTGAFFDESAADLETRVSTVGRLALTALETNTSVVYIAAEGLGVAPTIADELIDGDRTLEIKQVGTIKPGNEVFVYLLKVEN
jgi:cyclophilin family peptidyl-prolyl cis-trans isomerase